MPGTRPPPFLPPPAVTDTPYGFDAVDGGWYLRGDIGHRWGRVGNASTTAPFTAPSDSKLGDGAVGTVGGGYKRNWLRGDVTVDLGSSQKYTGTTLAPGDTTAKIQTSSILANGYLDLGSWFGFTPYVGAGAGATYLKMSDYQSAGAPPFTNTSPHRQWNFTWAAMAGVGWRVAPNMVLDLGYRYLGFGDLNTNTDVSGQTTFKNVAAHEVRIGVRWYFDDARH
ncbi:MAG: porin family protein [Pseudolabrys sp.]|nr:porin family protein [Pseudolabrys sp.]